jgi:hypothetical protein
MKAKAHATIQQPRDHTQRFRAEMDSRADTVCEGAAFYLVDE